MPPPDPDGSAAAEAQEAARQREIADACLGVDASPSGRLGLYRRLIQTNLAAVGRRLLPRTAACVDAACAVRFDALFGRFLAEAGPRTPYLRDVPGELVAWAVPRWAVDPDVPPYLSDLARYETDLFEVEAAAKSPRPLHLTEVALGLPLAFAHPRKLARYEFAVQILDLEPPRRGTNLFLFRDADNTVQATVIDESMRELFHLLLEETPLGMALERTAVVRANALLPGEDEGVEVARWLARLGEQGGLLGGRG